MKRVLLGGLLSCMVVGLMFANNVPNDVVAVEQVGVLREIWDKCKRTAFVIALSSVFGAGAYEMYKINESLSTRMAMRIGVFKGALTGSDFAPWRIAGTSLGELSRPVEACYFSSTHEKGSSIKLLGTFSSGIYKMISSDVD